MISRIGRLGNIRGGAYSYSKERCNYLSLLDYVDKQAGYFDTSFRLIIKYETKRKR